jgi:NAD(P)H-nitrite reductase large subunit
MRLNLPGGDLAHVHYLRTLADNSAIVNKAQVSRRAVVLGASFIGLNGGVASRASIDVAVVAPETSLWADSWADAGNFLRQLHEGME